MPDHQPSNLAAKYRKMMEMSAKPGTTAGTESTGGGESEKVDLSTEGIKDKLETSRENLYKIVETYLDNKSDLKEIVDRIIWNAKDPLIAAAENDDSYLELNPVKSSFLEVIVRTDGSRPSFMIRNGKADEDTSPKSDWPDIIAASGDCLTKAIECVGRIDTDDRHVGTGFLVQQNLVLTNRHVLQAIATKENDGNWYITPGTTIDFGYEFKARTSLNRRILSKVIFCGSQYIDPYNIDHSKLDMALITLEPVDQQMIPLTMLSVDQATDWPMPDKYIYIIGYPGNPGFEGLKTYKTLLEQLFKSTFGYKRLAPGIITTSTRKVEDWTVTYDATTLGGNSGSLILTYGNECVAAGIHYGGTLSAPRENWGHVLGKALGSTDGKTAKTLKDHMDDHNVVFTKTI